MTVEFFNTFVNICAEHSWNIHTDSGVNVDFDDFEEIRKDGYPYESRDFADYISTVFESLHNEDAKIMNNSLGVPIHPHHAESVQAQRTTFLEYFQEIYDEICNRGYSPMSVSDTEDDSEVDNNTNTAIESDDDDDDEFANTNHPTDHPLHIINTEYENGRVSWFTCVNNQRYEVTDNNVIMIDGNMVGNYDQENNHAYFQNDDQNITNLEYENGRVVCFTYINGERYEVSNSNSIIFHGNDVGYFDQEHLYPHFDDYDTEDDSDEDDDEDNDEPINATDLDEIRTLLQFDDEVEEEPQLPEQE